MGTAIGSVLRELRIKHNYQQQDITKMLNEMGIQTAKQQVSRWEHGYNNPNIPQFIGLCRIYGIKDAYKVFLQGDFSDLIYELNKEGADKLAEYKRVDCMRQCHANLKSFRSNAAQRLCMTSEHLPERGSFLTVIRMKWWKFPSVCRTAPRLGFMYAATAWSLPCSMGKRYGCINSRRLKMAI